MSKIKSICWLIFLSSSVVWQISNEIKFLTNGQTSSLCKVVSVRLHWTNPPLSYRGPWLFHNHFFLSPTVLVSPFFCHWLFCCCCCCCVFLPAPFVSIVKSPYRVWNSDPCFSWQRKSQRRKERSGARQRLCERTRGPLRSKEALV